MRFPCFRRENGSRQGYSYGCVSILHSRKCRQHRVILSYHRKHVYPINEIATAEIDFCIGANQASTASHESKADRLEKISRHPRGNLSPSDPDTTSSTRVFFFLRKRKQGQNTPRYVGRDDSIPNCPRDQYIRMEELLSLEKQYCAMPEIEINEMLGF